MKQMDAVKAYVSVRDLNKQKMSSGLLAKKVFDLYKALQPAWDFYTQEEKKIYENHPSYDSSINGIKITGSDEDKAVAINEVQQISKEFEQLNNLETEIDFEPFEIDLSSENLKLSGEDIGNLMPFINFI